MKKYILNMISAAALSATVLTGCIEETFPENGTATSDQVGGSATALNAAMNGLPSQMVQGYLVYGDQVNETDLAYPSLMLAQTELLGDIVNPKEQYGYNWWWRFNASMSLSDTQINPYLTYFTIYKFIKSANDIIAVVDMEDENVSAEIKGIAGMAYAFRAFHYYNLMVLFEAVDNIYTDCSKVLGLTVPIVTEETTNDIAKNNPRATHEKMVEFILSDLAIAETALTNYTPSSKLFPDLSVVYGIRAKVHMWDKDYTNAAVYARKAIDESGAVPMSEAEWTNPTTGFNTATSAWMWYLHPSPANMGNLANFIGHVSCESDWGYASLSKPQISRALYDQIADTDFRKYTFLDPNRDFYKYQSVRGNEWLDNQQDYTSIKFRCVGGDYKTYSVGAAADIPVMRVEEMYLIEAEAIGASKSVSEGVSALNNFMQTYRQPDYVCTTTDLREFQLEVLKQMRIEFWSEGVAFPNAKRLGPDIIQNYEGTNVVEDLFKINCKGFKPSWNMVIPKAEVDANMALQGMNNPDPSNAIPTRPTPIGQFAPGIK